MSEVYQDDVTGMLLQSGISNDSVLQISDLPAGTTVVAWELEFPGSGCAKTEVTDDMVVVVNADSVETSLLSTMLPSCLDANDGMAALRIDKGVPDYDIILEKESMGVMPLRNRIPRHEGRAISRLAITCSSPMIMTIVIQIPSSLP